ncbi:SGNH/GDSL hydrolase family protein [Nocardia sp. CA-107356]|uniref:SGNH/GDSL hydrolase family protein n=1 Tax=Nocardia sp. CA-107356 TaxID=3239972 RepID=UPI003D9154AE
MSRYLLTVLGDSVSAGWGDPAPDGGHRGWVSRFSSMTNLPPRSVHNLAEYGATVQHAVHHQLPHAVRGKAPLVVAFVGANDLLASRQHYDAALFQHNLRTIFDALTGADTIVVTANYPDIPGNLEVSESVRRALRDRFAEANEALAEIAEDTGVTCIDLCRPQVWREPTMWDADRLHPGPRLHQHFAEELVSLTQSSGLFTAA